VGIRVSVSYPLTPSARASSGDPQAAPRRGEGGEMTPSATGTAGYGNWVSARLVWAPAVLGLAFVGLAFVWPGWAAVAAFFLLCALYFALARLLFSPRGANLQARVQALLLDRLPEGHVIGTVLDVGCGSGSLTIQIAKKYPLARVTGIDTWGSAWEGSKGVCEGNAEIEGVAGRVAFQRGLASSLPFPSQSFDLVVSNLVFHEVRDVRDKSELIKEALRVLKDGGRFVFQDLFLWKQVYGDADALLQTLRSWGIETVELLDTSAADFIPRVLKLPFMLGTVAILHGKKGVSGHE